MRGQLRNGNLRTLRAVIQRLSLLNGLRQKRLSKTAIHGHAVSGQDLNFCDTRRNTYLPWWIVRPRVLKAPVALAYLNFRFLSCPHKNQSPPTPFRGLTAVA